MKCQRVRPPGLDGVRTMRIYKLHSVTISLGTLGDRGDSIDTNYIALSFHLCTNCLILQERNEVSREPRKALQLRLRRRRHFGILDMPPRHFYILSDPKHVQRSGMLNHLSFIVFERLLSIIFLYCLPAAGQIQKSLVLRGERSSSRSTQGPEATRGK